MLHRWNTQSYTVEGQVPRYPGHPAGPRPPSSKGVAYSALAVSDNGTFLGTGAMSEVVCSVPPCLLYGPKGMSWVLAAMSLDMSGSTTSLPSLPPPSPPQGLVDIYTAYNLVRVRRVRAAHSTFITGAAALHCSAHYKAPLTVCAA
jgi:hypothetical protein